MISKAKIENDLNESGERERLKELLRQRLKENGWHNSLFERCKKVIEEKGGIDTITADQLAEEITPFARKSVPDSVKTELLTQIRSFIQKKSGIPDL